CGDGPDGQCETQDTCDGAGACVDNHEAVGTNCGAAGTECTNQDTCDATGGCTDNGFVGDGAACGSAADTDCTNPDTCLSGACDPNDEASGTVCDDLVACTANDECDGAGTCAGVALDSVDLTIDLQGVTEPTVDRCITLELWDCPGAAGVPIATVDVTLTFTNGSFAGNVCIPSGTYSCITARDKLHTLRRTLDAADGFAFVVDHYVADFVTVGKDLLGGNLNDSFWLDIFDFGIYVGQFNDVLGGDTTCAVAGPHADISGDGTVFSEDFTFIQINFFQGHEANCCGATGASWKGGPVARVSVRELRRLGLHDMIAADLTEDGWVDEEDIAAFINGARPSPVRAVRP
ncbi:MAG: hypothetical protein O7D91_19055, partial [Planctomycetota bacterium]|nr:hypothetical protein [Planctomycetota bacterium]